MTDARGLASLLNQVGFSWLEKMKKKRTISDIYYSNRRGEHDEELILGEGHPKLERLKASLDNDFLYSDIAIPWSFFIPFRKETTALLSELVDGAVDRYVLESSKKYENIDGLLAELERYTMIKLRQLGRWEEIEITVKSLSQNLSRQ